MAFRAEMPRAETLPEPGFFTRLKGEGGRIKCGLCPHLCVVPPGGSGLCGVRLNRGANFEIPFYGFVTALARDPIEKKPLYHFRPGTSILSVGFAGCNMRCPFCQNWRISQTTDAGGGYVSPAEIIEYAEKESGQIAYTYSEPLVHIEFLLDCMREARKRGISNVLVTNGCVTSSPAEEILSLTDAANIDLKCFSGETYAKILGGDLRTVQSFINKALEKDVHVEITTLVVPGLNDSIKELDSCADFIAGLENYGRVVPWHLSAYHPDWKWEVPPTPGELLLEAAERARGRVAYVYTGNTGGRNDMFCPNCGKLIVSRSGYCTDTRGLYLKDSAVKDDSASEARLKKQYVCVHCGKAVPIRL